MAFRKQAALALALSSVIIMFGCTDELNAPNNEDTAPVVPPTHFAGDALTDGHVRATWTASSDPTINGYNLYRREVGKGSLKKINGTRIMSTQFLDSNTAVPKNYEYRLVAVNSKGKQSRYVSITVTTRYVLVPGEPKLPDANME